MSDLSQITTTLKRLFNEKGQRIVFWNDPDREFQITLSLLDLTGVTILRLDEVGALEAKVRIEKDEPTTKFLLHSPAEEPDYDNDWLLDIRLYSRPFRADRVSILLQELGLTNLHLRQHLSDRRKFFDAKERHHKLKTLVAPDDTAPDLDRKMLAVVAKADQPELFSIVRTIFHAWTETDEELDLDKPPAAWEQIEKFDLDVPFWKMVKTTFGYEEDSPSLKNFLLRLLLTDYANQELAGLIGHIINNLNGYHVVVTADHGFLFTGTSPTQTDKSKLDEEPDGTVLAKKRYLLGLDLPDHDAAWHGKTSVTAGVEGGMEFWIPKGMNRFSFTGAKRFLHGGAMPQEIVVPVLTVKHVRGKSAQETKIKLVTVQVLGTNHRITTARHRFRPTPCSRRWGCSDVRPYETVRRLAGTRRAATGGGYERPR